MSAGISESQLISANALKIWLSADTHGLSLPRANEALAWATKVWRKGDTWSDAAVGSALEPDRVYALVKVATDDFRGDPRRVQRLYELLSELDWPANEFDEKLDLLSQLAYLTSRQYRRLGEPRSAWIWENKTVELARQLPSVSDFLALEEQERTDQLRDRFFTDPRVLLALCAGLYLTTNLDPADSLRQTIATHEYLSKTRALSLGREERAWFLLQLEIIAAFAHKHHGNFADSAKWLEVASARCDLVTRPDISSARIEFIRRSIAYERHEFADARSGLPELLDKFKGFGMHRSAVLCTYLDGVVLKEMGRHAEALVQLQAVATDESSQVEGWLKGLALIYSADICAKEEEPQRGFEILSRAWALVGDSGLPTAIGHFNAVKGEILRDLGHLDAAIESYRLAVATYGSSRFRALEAQVRLILAETLLARERDAEALSEIAAALPIIETLGLVQEAVVAVALLRESMSRQSADRDALGTLRRALQGPHEGSRS